MFTIEGDIFSQPSAELKKRFAAVGTVANNGFRADLIYEYLIRIEFLDITHERHMQYILISPLLDRPELTLTEQDALLPGYTGVSSEVSLTINDDDLRAMWRDANETRRLIEEEIRKHPRP